MMKKEFVIVLLFLFSISFVFALDICADITDPIICDSITTTDPTWKSNPDIVKVMTSIQGLPAQEIETNCGEIINDSLGVYGGNCSIKFKCKCYYLSGKCIQVREMVEHRYGTPQPSANCLVDGDLIARLGTCEVEMTSEDGDCTNGNSLEYTIDWVGKWTNGSGSEVYSSYCDEGRKIIPCPAPFEVPFFRGFNFIIAISCIFVIYCLVSLRRKH